MKTHIISLRPNVWMSIEIGYIYPKSPPMDLEGIKQFGNNAKDINAILAGLNKTMFSKVMHCNTMKDIWEKLRSSMKEIPR